MSYTFILNLMYISYNCAISFLDNFIYIIILSKEKEDELRQEDD